VRAGLKADPYSDVLFENLVRATAHSKMRSDRAWQLIVGRGGDDDRLRALRDSLLSEANRTGPVTPA
jgi:hypothetical protein